MAVLDDASVQATLRTFVQGVVRLNAGVNTTVLSRILRQTLDEASSPQPFLQHLRQLAERQDGNRTILGGGPEFSPTPRLRSEGLILVVGEAQEMRANPDGYAIGTAGALMVLLIPLAGNCEVLQLVNDRHVTMQQVVITKSPARNTLQNLQALAPHARRVLELLAYRARNQAQYDYYTHGVHTLMSDGQQKAGIGEVAEAMRLRIPQLLPWREVDTATETAALEIHLIWQWLMIAADMVGLDPTQLMSLARALMEEERAV